VGNLNTRRQRLRILYLNDMIKESKARCAVCHCHVVRLGRVQNNGTLLRVNGGRVLYKSGKYGVWAGIATIGHIVDIEDGGTDDRGNLQLECYDCNNRKEREKTMSRKAKGNNDRL